MKLFEFVLLMTLAALLVFIVSWAVEKMIIKVFFGERMPRTRIVTALTISVGGFVVWIMESSGHSFGILVFLSSGVMILWNRFWFDHIENEKSK